MKKIIIGAVVLAVLGGLGYFASLHVSKEKEKTAEDLAIQEIIQSGVVVDDVVRGDVGSASEQNADHDANQGPESTLKVIASGAFNPDAEGSDALHRASGGMQVVEFQGFQKIVLEEDFTVTNGPDYELYVTTGDVIPETDDAFRAQRSAMTNLGRMTQFSGYQTFDIPADVDVQEITGAVIWCEQFGVFISSGAVQ